MPWGVYVDPKAKAVRLLAPKSPVKTDDGSPELAARAFFERYRDALYGADHADELRAVPKNDAITSEDDGAYVRFHHYLAGSDIRIFDVASTARFTADGSLLWLQSGFRADLAAVPRTAEVDASVAVAKALSTTAERCGDVSRAGATPPVSTLGVVTQESAPRLVWRVEVRHSTALCSQPTVTVDATTGEVLSLRDGAAALDDPSPGVRYEALGEKSNIRSIDVTKRIFTLSGKYVMVTESQPFVVATTSYGRFLNSEISTDTPGQWDTSAAAKGAAVDAHFNVAEALRYFRSVHGRRSTTGLGNPISVVAHYQFARSDGTKYGENAANNSFAWVVNEVQCGDGNYLSGGNMLPPCSALDVAAHEIAHGVTNYTSGLVYERESGALNESFSDAMGAAAENELETKEPARNFVIGERIMKNGAGFRDMQNTRPGAIDHYTNLRPCAGKPDLANDWCGVHSNSGIPNRAFTLMTAGGVHGTATSRVGVAQGIGFVVARDLWYGTFTKLAPDANFQTAALAQVVEASRHGLDALRAVGCAWLAVGVIRLDAHPLLSAVTCPVPGAAPAAPKSPDCQGRDNGWFCSENVQNSAVHCVGGATVGGSFCANTEQKCKKAAVDDWTAAVTPEGLVTCQ